MESLDCGFSTLLAHQERRSRRVRGFVVASVAVHLALLGIVSTLHAPSSKHLPGPAVKVTFVDQSSLPHPTVADPPPPPPPKRRSVRKMAEVKPEIKPRKVPREVVPANKPPPVQPPDDKDEQSDDAVDDGTEGGVAGGVVGGVVGGLVGSKTPPPRLAPAPAMPAQDEHLEAAALVETYEQRRDHYLVMLVLYVAQLLRQAGGVVIVDQQDHGDLVGTILLLARPFFLDKLFPDQIADCF